MFTNQSPVLVKLQAGIASIPDPYTRAWAQNLVRLLVQILTDPEIPLSHTGPVTLGQVTVAGISSGAPASGVTTGFIDGATYVLRLTSSATLVPSPYNPSTSVDQWTATELESSSSVMLINSGQVPTTSPGAGTMVMGCYRTSLAKFELIVEST